MEQDENDGFFVPHGYLSSDEEHHDENGKFFVFPGKTKNKKKISEDGELFQSSVADRQKEKQAAYEKMRKKKLKKLSIKVKSGSTVEPILILPLQVTIFYDHFQVTNFEQKALSGQPRSRLCHGHQAKGDKEREITSQTEQYRCRQQKRTTRQ